MGNFKLVSDFISVQVTDKFEEVLIINDPLSHDKFGLRGMVCRIEADYHYTLLHTKYLSSYPPSFSKEDF